MAHRHGYMVAAACAIGLLTTAPAWAQREVNCDRVPDNPACKREPVPAQRGTRTVPGQRPLKADPSSQARQPGADVYRGQQSTGPSTPGRDDRAPAYGATPTVPGMSPITPAPRQ